MGNIFSNNLTFATGTILALFGILASHRLLIYREKKKRLDDSANEFRKVFNQALADIDGDIFIFHTSMNDAPMKVRHAAYLNFRHYLRGGSRNRYDEAWKQYCYHYENIGRGQGGMSATLKKDFECLLAFTEYRVLRNVSFYWNNFWWKFRLKVFGPDKETKELIEKISKHYEPPKK